jgi:hypothetical protein
MTNMASITLMANVPPTPGVEDSTASPILNKHL